MHAGHPRPFRLAERKFYGALHRICSHMHTRKVDFPSGKAAVSITFDDFPCTAALNGAPILEDYDVRGTYYTCFGLLGADSESGKLCSLADVEDIVARGHEIGCHTYSHADAYDTPTEEFVADCRRNRDAALDLLGIELTSFAYPFSRIHPSRKRHISQHYVSSRMGASAISNRGRVDMSHLHHVPLYQGLGPDEIERRIRRCAEAGSWTIFYTHDVTGEPSKFGCTPATLERLLKFCRESAIEVAPVSTVANSLVRGTSREAVLPKPAPVGVLGDMAKTDRL